MPSNFAISHGIRFGELEFERLAGLAARDGRTPVVRVSEEEFVRLSELRRARRAERPPGIEHVRVAQCGENAIGRGMHGKIVEYVGH